MTILVGRNGLQRAADEAQGFKPLLHHTAFSGCLLPRFRCGFTDSPFERKGNITARPAERQVNRFIARS
jgi:hypothetical protein